MQTDAFQAFRGAYPFAAAFCAPAKGWEKGSVETGVTYVRNLVFRPRPTVASWAALNALIITELEADVATRRLADGRPVREAWTLERRHLRALPVHLPETCRVEARVDDKFGHVRADRVTYSVPTRSAYRGGRTKRCMAIAPSMTCCCGACCMGSRAATPRRPPRRFPGRIFQNLEAVRAAVADFVVRYNQTWRLEKLGYQTPIEAREEYELRQGGIAQMCVQGTGCGTRL